MGHRSVFGESASFPHDPTVVTFGIHGYHEIPGVLSPYYCAEGYYIVHIVTSHNLVVESLLRAFSSVCDTLGYVFRPLVLVTHFEVFRCSVESHGTPSLFGLPFLA